MCTCNVHFVEVLACETRFEQLVVLAECTDHPHVLAVFRFLKHQSRKPVQDRLRRSDCCKRGTLRDTA
jgi:hypothetical protein